MHHGGNKMKLHEMSEKQLWTMIFIIGFVIAILFYMLGSTITVQPVINYVTQNFNSECLSKCMIK